MIDKIKGLEEVWELQNWAVDKLIAYAKNPRKNDHAVEQMVTAIKTFGFRVPIVAKSDGSIVDGHLRLKAAKKIGMKIVPVLIADDMTDEQIKIFRISVNRMAELAEWDDDLLAAELQEIEDMGADVTLTGLDEGYIDKLVNELVPICAEKTEILIPIKMTRVLISVQTDQVTDEIKGLINSLEKAGVEVDYGGN